MKTKTMVLTAALVAATGLGPGVAAAQSVATRSPNLTGGWTAPPGVIQFNFIHRFTITDRPLRKVINTPSFNVGTGITDHLMVGFVYGSNSTLVPAYPNEWELYARAMPLAEEGGAPLDLSLQAGYNVASESVDGELLLARSFGRLRVLAAGRAFSEAYDSTEARFAVAGGAVLRLTRSISVAGDYGVLLDRADDERTTWGAGLQLGVPYTPHSFSIQVTNVGTASLEGASRGTRTRWGFEYTVPITIRRYLPAGDDDQEEQDADRSPLTSAASRPVPATSKARTSPKMAPPEDAPDGPADVPSTVGMPGHRTSGHDVPAPSAPARHGTARATSPQEAATPGVRIYADTVVIEIRNLKYSSEEVTVEPGTTVAWLNKDPLQHSINATDSTFNSDLIEPDSAFTWTFTEPGTFPYHCAPHPFMKGRVIVKESTEGGDR